MRFHVPAVKKSGGFGGFFRRRGGTALSSQYSCNSIHYGTTVLKTCLSADKTVYSLQDYVVFAVSPDNLLFLLIFLCMLLYRFLFIFPWWYVYILLYLLRKYTILDNLLQKLHISCNPFPIGIIRVTALHITKIPRLRMSKTTSIYAHSIGNPCFPMLFLLSSSCRAVAMRICSILRHILTTERKKPPLSRRTTKVAYSGGSRTSSLATAPAIDRYIFSIGGGITPAAGGRIPVFSHGRTMQAPVFCRMLTSPLLYHTFLLCEDMHLQFQQTAVLPCFREIIY